VTGELQVLPTRRREVCDDAVKALEEALELARAGKVEDLSIVLHVNDAGETSVMYRGTATSNVARAVGDLVILQHNLLTTW
jgi:hypothetical protein